jgi:hypothetical protein
MSRSLTALFLALFLGLFLLVAADDQTIRATEKSQLVLSKP